MVMPPCGHLTVGGATGRDGGQNTHGAACKGSYRVTSIGPVGARPACGPGPTDHREGTRGASRGKGQTQPHRQSTPSMSVVVLGQLSGLVEVAEPSEGLQGALVVVGEVEAVELL